MLRSHKSELSRLFRISNLLNVGQATPCQDFDVGRINKMNLRGQSMWDTKAATGIPYIDIIVGEYSSQYMFTYKVVKLNSKVSIK